MAKNTNNTFRSFAPIGTVKPGSYTISTPRPAHPPDPVSKEEREILGFYDQTRAVSIDRDSDLFVYNFKIPQTPRARRGIGLKVHHPLLGVNLSAESSLFWRPRLLVARMRYFRKTAKYNPYLRHAQEREAREAFEVYLRLREDEEKRKTKVMGKRELMEYVKVLEDREKARQAEEQVDAVRMNKLCEESGLSMERD
ncbi:hypothetical protein Q9L58_003357 [Maublancomyces gigas]|uniref:Uncharacterized protein n=1 Tax=Discina gigas TaxID=1032678 RepID=A0ABR3GNX3_9PEZI